MLDIRQLIVYYLNIVEGDNDCYQAKSPTTKGTPESAQTLKGQLEKITLEVKGP